MLNGKFRFSAKCEKHLPSLNKRKFCVPNQGKLRTLKALFPSPILLWANTYLLTPTLSQEKSLFRKLLYTNAARVTQDNGSDVWKDSFVCPLFPRERTVFQSGGKFK